MDFDADRYSFGDKAPIFFFTDEGKPEGAWIVPARADYENLFQILIRAFQQSAYGKGADRHASGERFEEQPIISIARQVGPGFLSGQAVKKIFEAGRLPSDRGVAEILGAIVYLCALVYYRENVKEKENG